MRKLLVVLVVLTLLATGCIKLGGGAADKLPKVHLFQASPESVEMGQQVMLSWEVSDASAITIEPGLGAVEATGSKLVTVTAPTTFTLTATNRYGKTDKAAVVAVGQSGGVAVEKPPVQGGGALPPSGGQIAVKPEVIFTATPSTIGPGLDAELSWSVKYADSVSIDQGIGAVAAAGTMKVRPSKTTVYTLSARNNFSETVLPVTVKFTMEGFTGILPPSDNKSGAEASATLPWWLQPYQQGGTQTLGSLQSIVPADAAKGSGAGGLQGIFYALPNPALPGQTVRLYWNTISASRVDLLDDYNEYVKKNMALSGNLDIVPSGTIIYKLRVTGASDSLDLRYTITVE